ncbi:zinc finger protein 135-like [Contarinia nasturtii]|uniref:zinc finger protein 135-like n=1 Tax=Contarinia nasturtii TaxID=265458 RepID=UPI0012D4495E|nr:zinc finger protein 135-like [Contarinia nasturtii]
MHVRRDRQPPDKNWPKKMPSEASKLLLTEAEIKAEPTIKEEPEDAGNKIVVPTSELADNRPRNAIGADQIDQIIDFDGVEVKPEVKTENNEKKSEDGSSGHQQSGAPKRSVDKDEQKATTSKGKATTGNDGCKGKRYNDKKDQAAAKPIGKKHECPMCEYSSSTKSNLKRHIVTHTGEKPFSCTLCPKRFNRKHRLQYHMKTHVNEFLFSCSNCLQGFSTSNEQMEHEADCKVKRYECFSCKKYSTLHKHCLKRHMQMHNDERLFQCNDCSKEFKWAESLKRHTMRIHINPRPLKFKCSIFFRNFNQQAERGDHEGHCKRRGYQCHVCQQFKSNDLSSLRIHLRTHTGVKPFQCGYCSKCFTQQAHYNVHMKIPQVIING